MSSALRTLSVPLADTILTGTARSSLREQLQSLLDEIARLAVEPRDGFVVQFGWSPVILRARPDGYALVARDYAADPNTDTDDLSLVLWLAQALIAVPERAGLQPQQVRDSDAVIAVPGVLQAGRVTMTRGAAGDEGDSGWLLEADPLPADRGYLPTQLVRLQTWQLLRGHVHAARALALPEGSRAVIGPDGIREVRRLADETVLTTGPF